MSKFQILIVEVNKGGRFLLLMYYLCICRASLFQKVHFQSQFFYLQSIAHCFPITMPILLPFTSLLKPEGFVHLVVILYVQTSRLDTDGRE